MRRGKDENRHSWSATPLWVHLQRHHATEHAKAEEQRAKESNATKKRKGTDKERQELYVNGTPKLLAYVTRKQKYLPESKEQKDLNKLLSDWIADGVLPYAIVDNARFLEFLDKMDPKYDCPSSKTLRTKIFPQTLHESWLINIFH